MLSFVRRVIVHGRKVVRNQIQEVKDATILPFGIPQTRNQVTRNGVAVAVAAGLTFSMIYQKIQNERELGGILESHISQCIQHSSNFETNHVLNKTLPEIRNMNKSEILQMIRNQCGNDCLRMEKKTMTFLLLGNKSLSKTLEAFSGYRWEEFEVDTIGIDGDRRYHEKMFWMPGDFDILTIVRHVQPQIHYDVFLSKQMKVLVGFKQTYPKIIHLQGCSKHWFVQKDVSTDKSDISKMAFATNEELMAFISDTFSEFRHHDP